MAAGPDLGLILPADRANDRFTESHRSGATDRLWPDCGLAIEWAVSTPSGRSASNYRTFKNDKADGAGRARGSA